MQYPKHFFYNFSHVDVSVYIAILILFSTLVNIFVKTTRFDELLLKIVQFLTSFHL